MTVIVEKSANHKNKSVFPGWGLNGCFDTETAAANRSLTVSDMNNFFGWSQNAETRWAQSTFQTFITPESKETDIRYKKQMNARLSLCFLEELSVRSFKPFRD